MTNELEALLHHAMRAGDLYTCAVCEIAMQGYPRTNTWEALDTPLKMQLHREYLNADACTWQREKAQTQMSARVKCCEHGRPIFQPCLGCEMLQGAA